MSALREHQLRLLDLLVEFDSVCTRLGITWWIDSGTLLGAVRHGGFIPWDDDLDVCVLASDYRKIRRAFSAHLSSPYAFHCSKRGQTRLSPRFVDTGQSVLRHDPLTGAPREEKLWIDTFVLRPGGLRLKKAIDPLYGRCVRRINGSIRDGALKRIAAYMLFPVMWVAKELAIIIGSCSTGRISCTTSVCRSTACEGSRTSFLWALSRLKAGSSLLRPTLTAT